MIFNRVHGFARHTDPLGQFGLRQLRILPGNVGYIDMSNFAHIDFENETDPVKAAVDSVLTLVEPADGLIIDLRDNGGGAPSLVGYLVSAFTSRSAQIYNTFQYRGGQTSEAPAQFHSSPELDEPLYILTSSRTASAAEALPYTLQAAGRAVIVSPASLPSVSVPLSSMLSSEASSSRSTKAISCSISCGTQALRVRASGPT